MASLSTLPSPPNQNPILTVPDADVAIRQSVLLYLARLVTALQKLWVSADATWNPGTVANTGFVSATVTVRGLAPPNPVMVGFTTAIPAGMVLHAVCTSPDTVTVTLVNFTGAPQTIASGTLHILGSPTL